MAAAAVATIRTSITAPITTVVVEITNIIITITTTTTTMEVEDIEIGYGDI
jgi:hypothetical protein